MVCLPTFTIKFQLNVCKLYPYMDPWITYITNTWHANKIPRVPRKPPHLSCHSRERNTASNLLSFRSTKTKPASRQSAGATGSGGQAGVTLSPTVEAPYLPWSSSHTFHVRIGYSNPQTPAVSLKAFFKGVQLSPNPRCLDHFGRLGLDVSKIWDQARVSYNHKWAITWGEITHWRTNLLILTFLDIQVPASRVITPFIEL